MNVTVQSAGYNYFMRKMRPRVRALKLAKKVRERLTEAFGQSVEVIMYGSQARGDATRYSDIDLLVILPYLDINTRSLVSDIVWEVGFDAGRLISAVPTTKDKIERYSFLPFYQNVQKDGIPV